MLTRLEQICIKEEARRTRQLTTLRSTTLRTLPTA